MVRFTDRVLRVALALFGALALVAPAGAHAAGCPGQSLAQAFLPWTDPAWYTPVPDGGFEARAAVWALRNGATVVADNEPYRVGAAVDRWSLALPPGASATSGALCIGVAHPTLRFFVRNSGSQTATLAVSVEFRDPDGSPQSLPIGLVTGGSDWGPTVALPVAANVLSPASVNEAAFRFAATDGGGTWWIDDVYVDPYGKG